MPKLLVRVNVGEIMEALDIVDLPEDCRFTGKDDIEIDADVAQGDIDDEATEVEPEPVEIELRDLRDGIRAMVAGDWLLARTILIRAFEEQEGAALLIETELRSAMTKAAA